MSKRELKALELRFKDRLWNNYDKEFEDHYLELKPHLDMLERDISEQVNELQEKDHEWLKWLTAIAAGVFSVIVSQVFKMSSLSADQLILLKIAISANALGILFGATYLYKGVKYQRDVIRKIQIQRYYLILENREKYDNVVKSDRLPFSELCKPLSLICFLAVIVIWVWFVWQM